MNIKNILFDLSAAQPGFADGFHGGGEYAKAVFLRLCELFPADTSLEVFYNPDRKMEQHLLDLCKTKGFTINLCGNNTEISKLLDNKKYTVFYTALAYSYSDLVIPAETKFIYTIHGLRSMEYPVDRYELKYRKSNLKAKVKHIISLLFPLWWRNRKLKIDIHNFNKLFSLAEKQTIITVSKHSKFAISYFFPALNNSQIKILYSPLKNIQMEKEQNISDILNSLSVGAGKYILMLNGDRTEKGAYRACKVICDLFKNHGSILKDIKVIVLGVYYRESYLKLTNNSNRFIFHNYVSANDLEMLYKNARLFLFPTLNEGFGYPPLEAMKYGTICACSANSAITEIYGDSVLYFNPHDEVEMGIRILQSFDEDIRKEKSSRMSLRYQTIREKQEQDLDLLIQEIIA
jgi:glycosyltransferase involved in cell wall biosynthesis